MIYPVLLCLFASLSTGVGGIAIIFIKNFSDRAMAFFQGFAAGVMITVSFVEMLPRCYHNIKGYMEAEYAALLLLIVFIFGWLAGWGISAAADYICKDSIEYTAAKRLSLVTTAVMVLHNLPEGMLTVFSGMEDIRFGMNMALAVALHNIPEGLVVASGTMYVTSSKYKAVGHSFFAGISEFIGGMAAVIVFKGMISNMFTGVVLAAVGGMMVQISACELLPNSFKICGKSTVFTGFLAGGAIIYFSLYGF